MTIGPTKTISCDYAILHPWLFIYMLSTWDTDVFIPVLCDYVMFVFARPWPLRSMQRSIYFWNHIATCCKSYTIANIPISIQVQSHHREAVVLTMLGKQSSKIVSVCLWFMTTLILMTHCLAAYIHIKLVLCIFWAGLAEYMCLSWAAVRNTEYIYLLSSEVIVSNHLKHGIWIHDNLHLR